VTTWEAAVKELASKNVESADVGSVEEQAPPDDADQDECAVQFAAVPKVRFNVQVPVPVAVMEFIPATNVTGEPEMAEVPEVTVPEAPEAIYISNVPCAPSSTKFIVLLPAVAHLPSKSELICAPSTTNTCPITKYRGTSTAWAGVGVIKGKIKLATKASSTIRDRSLFRNYSLQSLVSSCYKPVPFRAG
jgi:hypothetical protein